MDDSDGFEGDMEVGVGGTVHIAHDDWFYRDLYYAGKDSSGWYIEVVSWSGSRGWSPSMYLVFSDNPHIFHSRSSSSEIVWWGSDSLSIGEGPDPGPDPGHGETIIAVSGNPVRSSSEVRLMIPQAGEYELSVFDMAGRRNRVLFRGHLDEGEYDMFFDPASLQEGAYFLRPTGGTVDCSRSVIVLE
ncbi:MAG: hypothetical protein JXR55_00145 [Candidatus Fermentibacteraceae bacterium]|nr:hypothetical protein [Candidatus Fermentibacteraceae bacterium]